LYGDFAGHLMLGYFLASRHDETDEFELFGFDERRSSRLVKASREWPYIDDIHWPSVWDRHVLSPSLIAGSRSKNLSRTSPRIMNKSSDAPKGVAFVASTLKPAN
jgi:hypothetical protein